MPPPEKSAQDVEDFLMELGLGLHRLGTSADLLEAALSRIARRFKLTAHIFSTPTLLLACFGRGDSRHVYLQRGDQGEANLGKLSRLTQLSEAVCLEKMAPALASEQVRALLAAPPNFGRIAVMLANALCSGAVARLIGGSFNEMIVAGIIGLLLGFVTPLMAERPRLMRLHALAMAVLSAVCSAVLAQYFGPLSVRTATLAGLIYLLPGLTTTTALTELATGNLVAGTSRLMGAVVTFLQLGFGVAFGAHIGHRLLASVSEPLGTTSMWTEWPALTIAALSLAVMLQAELRDFVWILLCSLCGLCALRYGGRWAGAQMTPLGAAFTVTLLANLYARYSGRSASVLQVPAMLLLVPGSIGYRSVAALMDRDVVAGMQTGFVMAVDTVALVAGALLAGLLLPPHEDL